MLAQDLREVVVEELAGVTPKVEAHKDQEVCAQRVSLQVVQGRIGSGPGLDLDRDRTAVRFGDHIAPRMPGC